MNWSFFSLRLVYECTGSGQGAPAARPYKNSWQVDPRGLAMCFGIYRKKTHLTFNTTQTEIVECIFVCSNLLFRVNITNSIISKFTHNPKWYGIRCHEGINRLHIRLCYTRQK